MRRDIGTDDPRVKVRRGRKGKKSPRRSKDHVDYSGAPAGFVTAVDRGRFTVELEHTTLRAVKARELGRHAIVVGDRVRVVGDLSGRPDTLARLVEVEARSSELTRSAEDTPGVREKPMVANVDLMVIVAACADPPPRPRMVDRCLVAAYAAGVEPLLVATKADLAPPEPLLDQFTGLDLDAVVTSLDGAVGVHGAEELRARLESRSTVLVGHSGVGKSTLMNALIPSANRRTGAVNAVTGRGRHTSTGAVALPLGDGWLIDTPGIRSFGLAHVATEDVLGAFGDLDEAASACPRRCTHLASAPDCALDTWATTPLRRARLDSFRRLLAAKALAPEPWEVDR